MEILPWKKKVKKKVKIAASSFANFGDGQINIFCDL